MPAANFRLFRVVQLSKCVLSFIMSGHTETGCLCSECCQRGRGNLNWCAHDSISLGSMAQGKHAGALGTPWQTRFHCLSPDSCKCASACACLAWFDTRLLDQGTQANTIRSWHMTFHMLPTRAHRVDHTANAIYHA